MKDRFKLFIVISIAITLALAGLAFTKSETQGNHIEHQQTQQTIDREVAVEKNVEARRGDCINNNELRKGLRIGVREGEKNTPLLLSLVPSLNTKRVLTVLAKENARELKAYAPLDCESYALRAAPPQDRSKLTLAQQQQEIDRLITALQVAQSKEHNARLVTISQRCELTQIILSGTTNTTVRAKLQTSLTNCEHQLAKIKAGH